MSIDWITVSAQVINFLVLVWLLKRFLYRPIISAMARREARIAARLNEAQQREAAADAEGARFRERHDALEHERSVLLSAAREEAEQLKDEMLEDARAEVLALRSNWRREALEERDEFLITLRRQACEALERIARRALGDLADADLEDRVVTTFLARLADLDDDTRRGLSAGASVRVSSAFELAPATRGRITRAVHAALTKNAVVDFDQSAELICGIALSAGGRQVSWNVVDYMDELETHLRQAFSPLEQVSDG